jgi:hypothetical protein
MNMPPSAPQCKRGCVEPEFGENKKHSLFSSRTYVNKHDKNQGIMEEELVQVEVSEGDREHDIMMHEDQNDNLQVNGGFTYSSMPMHITPERSMLF